MMTIHGAKGLEFKQVYIVGLEEDLFPSQMMLESREDLEEERRLFYVAITRAEKKLYISYAETRYQYGRLKPCEPSRFLDEINPMYLEFSKSRSRQSADEREYYRKPAEAFAANIIKKPVAGFASKVIPPKPAPVLVNHTPSADFSPSNTSQLVEGQKVEHAKFGFGMVKKIEQNGNDRKAVIEFEKGVGEKTLLLSFAKLSIIS
jgi:DNA helicase-2/ATP-dependent DNA helicase PcrA